MAEINHHSPNSYVVGVGRKPKPKAKKVEPVIVPDPPEVVEVEQVVVPAPKPVAAVKKA